MAIAQAGPTRADEIDDLLTREGPMSRGQIARRLNLDSGGVRHHLFRLEHEGRVGWTHGRYGRVWEAIPDNSRKEA